jgi:type IV pilus assembly protein PilE
MIKTGKQAGFSLIELMIVITIMALLATLAVTSYQNSIRKARRADAKTVLMETAMFLERNYTETNSYNALPGGSTLGNNELPHPEAPIDGNSKFYDIQFLSGPTTHSFTIEAAPKNAQLKDTQCAKLTIDETGSKDATGPGTVGECWAR